MQDVVPWTLREDFESKIKENKKNCLFQLQVILQGSKLRPTDTVAFETNI